MRTGRTSGRTIWPSRRTYSAVGPVAAAKTPTLLALLALVLAGSLPAGAGAAGQRHDKPRNLKAPRIAGKNVVGRHCHAVKGARKRVYRLVTVDAGKRMRIV